MLLFLQKVKSRAAAIECHERLGGLVRYYLPERFAWEGGAGCPLVSAVLARGVCAVIFQCFYAAENVSAKMLLFFRKSAKMDIFRFVSKNYGRVLAQVVFQVHDIRRVLSS